MGEKEVLALSAGLCMAGHFLPHLREEAAELWSKLKALLPEELARQGDDLSDALFLPSALTLTKPAETARE